MRLPVLFLASALLAFAAPVRADLMVNGSFENPVLPNGGQQSVSGSFPGWTVLGDPTQFFNTNYMESGVRFDAEAGVQSIDVSGYTNTLSNGVEQTVATTIGQTYQLSFYVGRADYFDPTLATVNLSINGGSRVHYTNTGLTTGQINWKQFTVDFTATTTGTTLAFLNGTPSTVGVVAGLDNVSLTAVPELSTLIMSSVMSGLFGVAWSLKRLRRRWLRPTPVDPAA